MAILRVSDGFVPVQRAWALLDFVSFRRKEVALTEEGGDGSVGVRLWWLWVVSVGCPIMTLDKSAMEVGNTWSSRFGEKKSDIFWSVISIWTWGISFANSMEFRFAIRRFSLSFISAQAIQHSGLRLPKLEIRQLQLLQSLMTESVSCRKTIVGLHGEHHGSDGEDDSTLNWDGNSRITIVSFGRCCGPFGTSSTGGSSSFVSRFLLDTLTLRRFFRKIPIVIQSLTVTVNEVCEEEDETQGCFDPCRGMIERSMRVLVFLSYREGASKSRWSIVFSAALAGLALSCVESGMYDFVLSCHGTTPHGAHCTRCDHTTQKTIRGSHWGGLPDSSHLFEAWVCHP